MVACIVRAYNCIVEAHPTATLLHILTHAPYFFKHLLTGQCQGHGTISQEQTEVHSSTPHMKAFLSDRPYLYEELKMGINTPRSIDVKTCFS